MKAFSNFHIMSNYIKQIKIKQIKLDAKVRYFLRNTMPFSEFLFKRRKPLHLC